MKNVILLFGLMISAMVFSQNFSGYRSMITKAAHSEADAKKLMEMADRDYNQTCQPVYAGFLAVGNFFMAKHAFNPLKKMNYFEAGKTLLAKAVLADPKNAELRLIRLKAQEEAPKILGFRANIREDRAFLAERFDKINDPVLKNHIQKYLNL